MDFYKQLVGLLGRVISFVARPLPTHDNTNREGGQTSTPPLGFEPTIPVFEGAKTSDALDRVVTVFGNKCL
jgi:hypothetical protein